MDIARETKAFASDWELDFWAKAIRRKPRRFRARLRDSIRPRRYPVLALYRFLKQHEASEAGIVYPDVIDRDHLPSVDAIPVRYALNPQWSIPPSDLEVLYLGPLTQGATVLVPAFPLRGFFITTWEILKVLGVIGSVIGGVAVVLTWLG